MEKERSIVIIGGGISGLALGAYIKDAGFNCIILEKENRVGGHIRSIQQEGATLEWGSISTPGTTAFKQLIEIVGVQDQLIKAKSPFYKRAIVKKNKLFNPELKLAAMLTSGLLSLKGKRAIMGEKHKDNNPILTDESLGKFFERRFGQEAVDYIINPFVNGICAGDAYQLGMKAVLPYFLEWEARHGSISKAIKKEAFPKLNEEHYSFKGGMQTLVDALKTYIGDEDILLNTNVNKVRRPNESFQLDIEQEGMTLQIEADVVVFATPAYVTARLMGEINADMAGMLNKVEHPRLGTVHLNFDNTAVKRNVEGFGFVVPKLEHKHLLAATYSSALFPQNFAGNQAAFTLTVGGVQQANFLEHQDVDAFIQKAVEDFMVIMKIKSPPVFQQYKIIEKSIPQYGVDHHLLLEGLEMFEKNMSNIHFIGSYRNGLNISDCILGAKQAHGRLVKDYSFQSYYKQEGRLPSRE